MPNLRRRGERPSRANVIPDQSPRDDEARRLLEVLSNNLPDQTSQLDVLVSTRSGRARTKVVRAHLCTVKLPAGSFIPTEAGGVEFSLSSPELVFLQMAEELEFDHLVYVGFALCSAFRLDDYAPGGCDHREIWDSPLTSVDKIKSYLDRLPAGMRNVGCARKALSHVRDGARSPKEAGLAMMVGLPVGMGGYALGETQMNPELKFHDGDDQRGNPRWVTRIPDVLVSAVDQYGKRRRVGIDYDPTSTHGDPIRVAMDIDRRNLLTASGSFAHLTITELQAKHFDTFDREMDRVRRALGQRKKPRIVGNRDSWDNRQILIQARLKHRDLWRRVLGRDRLIL